jgi:FeS assembly SUF system protein
MDPLGPDSSAPAATAASPPVADPARTLELKPLVVEALSSVFDPEIPVNIYELGLVYDIVIDAESVVHVTMTLTSPACPAAQHLPSDVASKVRAVPGVSEADVQVVWDPPWSMDRMSDMARLQLGF